MSLTLVTKTKLAEELGVGKSAVSNWIERGIISGDAIVGEGRKAKINLELARDQVRKKRDIGQSFGNGIATKVSPPKAIQEEFSASLRDLQPRDDQDAETTQPRAHPTVEDEAQEKILKARLERLERQNRIEAVKEAEQLGNLMSVEDARIQMTRISGMLLMIFEGALTDFASALSSKFDVPQRDALHLLKNEFRNVRAKATMKQRAEADQTSQRTSSSNGMES